MRVVCRDENEQENVKSILMLKLPEARILDSGGQQIRVDGVSRTYVLVEQGNAVPSLGTP